MDLNHRPHAYQACALTTWAISPLHRLSLTSTLVVEMRRIELLTPCVQGRCSPSWATPPYKGLGLTTFPTSFKGPLRPSKLNNMIKSNPSSISILHRKEVIQPHLPIRLPCYDFTPIINPTFGSVLLAVRLLTSGVANSHGVTGGVYKARERIHRNILICDY